MPKIKMEKVSKTAEGILVLDIPVIHRGYVEFLNRHAKGDIGRLLLVGDNLRAKLGVPNEIRANPAELTQKMLAGLDLPFGIEILHEEDIEALPKNGIFTARDTVSKKLKEQFFPNAELTDDNIFLRWDESNVATEKPANIETETKDPFHIKMMKHAKSLADNSSDWWRQVGVVIAKDGEIIMDAYNQSLPTENKPYIDGGPRDHVQSGTMQFLVTTTHAEAAAIAKVARSKDLSTDGADLYLNSFPCPPCATAMGLAGIRRCFAGGTNAYLDAAETLKSLGIETIFVNEN